jgi:hypothetical protein
MQSDTEYGHAVVLVDMAHKHGGSAKDTMAVNDDVPIDGVVDLRYPRETPPPDGWEDGDDTYWRHSIPFRNHRRDGHPWFGRPDADEWSRCPVWKWLNPNETVENITLSPSYGMRDSENGGYKIHCYIHDGEADLL